MNARGCATVYAHDKTTVHAEDHAVARLFDAAQLTATGFVIAYQHGTSRVRARGQVQVYADNPSLVTLEEQATLTRIPEARVVIHCP